MLGPLWWSLMVSNCCLCLWYQLPPFIRTVNLKQKPVCKRGTSLFFQLHFALVGLFLWKGKKPSFLCAVRIVIEDCKGTSTLTFCLRGSAEYDRKSSSSMQATRNAAINCVGKRWNPLTIWDESTSYFWIKAICWGASHISFNSRSASEREFNESIWD